MRPLRLMLCLAPVLVLACDNKAEITLDDTEDSVGGEGDADADSDADSDTDADSDGDADLCTAEISAVDPRDGLTDAPLNPAITATLTAAITEADYTVSLSGPDGAVDGTASLGSGDTVITFRAQSPLERASEYTATFTVCSENASTSFTTVGNPHDEALEGRTYDVDLNQVTWHAPSAGSLLVGQLETDHLLFMVQDVDLSAQTIDFVGAVGLDDNGVQQYACAAAFDYDPADFSGNPAFQVGPADTTFGGGGFDVNVWSLETSGAFNTSGNSLNNLRIRGYLDVRELEFNGIGVCAVAETILGQPCVACPNDGVVGCLQLDIESATAPWVRNLTIDPNVDPTTDPNCQ